MTKTPVVGLTVTAYQFPDTGKVRCVHVIPSVEEAALFELVAVATKRPVMRLQVTAAQSPAGIVRAVQVIPLVEEAATPPE